MAETTISWTATQGADGSWKQGYSYNLGWGCTKKSAGCVNCYAERESNRFGFDVWGAGKERRRMSGAYLKMPLKWNRKAEAAGERRRVFCGSMMDWTDPEWIDMLPGLWQMWHDTPWLDWLMLTKNADRIIQSLPHDWDSYDYHNVWLGVTAEDQENADKRIPLLTQIPASVIFISVEPMIEPIYFRDNLQRLDWVIFGCESGPHRRPCGHEWILHGIRQCRDAGVAVFVKQIEIVDGRVSRDLADWPEYLRVQEFPR